VRICSEEIEVNAVTTFAFGSSSASCSAALAPWCASVMPPALGTMIHDTGVILEVRRHLRKRGLRHGDEDYVGREQGLVVGACNADSRTSSAAEPLFACEPRTATAWLVRVAKAVAKALPIRPEPTIASFMCFSHMKVALKTLR
jgi:hypothetical protein